MNILVCLFLDLLIINDIDSFIHNFCKLIYLTLILKKILTKFISLI